jgi:dTDP-4-dehydrorhamnose reductase
VRVAGDRAVPFTHGELDVVDGAAVRRVVAEVAPDLVVNCAAWTDVDGAEHHEADALRVNVQGARNLARAAADADAAIVYVSSDYVFDGRGDRPYLESDQTGPISSYGRTKLTGERVTAEANPRHYIVRSSWLFGVGGKNFVDTMIRVGQERGEAKVVHDQVGSPTYTGHLAEGLLQIAETGDYGVHHLAGGGECSWYEFAREIFERAGVDVRLEPCTTAEFPRPAPRPAYSVLGNERPEPVTLPAWQEGLAAYLAERENRA